MRSIILSTVARAMLPILIMFSLFLLWRGHNEPGGGFTGGLVAAAGVILFSLAYSPRAARRVVRVDLKTLTGFGLLMAAGSGTVAVFAGKPFLTGVWWKLAGPQGSTIELGTPFFFDLGVYLVVIGVTLSILFSKAEEEERP
ncbi:MAG: Na+/H+ antiporter subunit B [Fimbriimonadaceae bacterium]|nr:Na+/H+ antiporter subunit B [Fimbriimonadaceae bacterium]